MNAQNLALKVTSCFEEAKTFRRTMERRWLEDLQQYKGIYPGEVTKNFRGQGCKAFVNKTRGKVRALKARLCDILIPDNGEPAWSIAPTPDADPHPAAMEAARLRLMQIAMEKAQQGGMPDAAAGMLPQGPDRKQVKQAAQELCAEAAKSMSRRIADQLAEGLFGKHIRKTAESISIYGTGVLKGPLVQQDMRRGWVVTENGGWEMQTVAGRIRPFFEQVPVWALYPDPGAVDIEECRYIVQRHKMLRHDLKTLGAGNGFDQVAIARVLRDNPTGNYSSSSYETDLRHIGKDAGTDKQESEDGRFEVLEFWGLVPLKDIISVDEEAAGLLEQGDENEEVVCNVWVCGKEVLRVVAAPLQGMRHRLPYYFSYLNRDETSIWGEGLPRVLRDLQSLVNAGFRAMIDNMAVAAGPQVEANVDLLEPGEDLGDLSPFRIWLRHGQGQDAQVPALRAFQVPNYAGDYLRILGVLEQYLNEESGIPGGMEGQDRTYKGAGRTVRGLSMLLSAAGISIADAVQDMDKSFIEPFIAAMYHWNMELSEDDAIKGDMRVQALGSTNGVAKELHREQLELFAQGTANGLDAPWIRRDALLKKRCEAMNLPGKELLKPAEEVEQTLAGQGALEQQVSQLVDVVAELQQRQEKMLEMASRLMEGQQHEAA